MVGTPRVLSRRRGWRCWAVSKPWPQHPRGLGIGGFWSESTLVRPALSLRQTAQPGHELIPSSPAPLAVYLWDTMCVSSLCLKISESCFD